VARSTISEAALRDLRTIFEAGAGGGRPDGELLERFVERSGPDAEAAFAVLVARHGPMVQRVARSVLRDRHEADDAFQAAFLVLSRRAGSLCGREEIGPWLYGVTVRVASKMRVGRARRLRRDAEAAKHAPVAYEPEPPDDLGAALHEEIARLPDRHRLPVVLCLVEGLSHDAAAVRLGWPVGTVRSRLARARERLRERLARRGLSPSVTSIGTLLVRSGDATVARRLAAEAARAAVSCKSGSIAAGTVPATVAATAQDILRSFLMVRIQNGLIGLAALSLFATGATLTAPRQAEESPTSGSATSARVEPRQEPNETIVRAYNVADLVRREFTSTEVDLGDGKKRRFNVQRRIHWEPLIALLTDSVAPGTWSVHSDGLTIETDEAIGSIRTFDKNVSLIIRHTPEVHDEVVERLRQLRRIVEVISKPVEEQEERRLDSPAAQKTGSSDTSNSNEVKNDSSNGDGRDMKPVEETGITSPSTTIRRPVVVRNNRSYTVVRPVKPPERKAKGSEASDGERPNADDRLDNLERKLDAIIDELRALRRDESPR